MHKRSFFAFFISLHLFFLILLIDKQTRLSHTSYQKQALEQTLKKLKSQKYMLTNELYDLQNHQKIKMYAIHELKMNPLALKKIKKIQPQKEIYEKA